MRILSTSACAAALLVCACASDESARRPTATAQTEPEHRHHREHDSERAAVEPIDANGVEHSDADHHEPDNTGRNARDRGRDRDVSVAPVKAVTPLDQGNHASDIETTRKIRQAVTGDDSLSFDAKNVKIITSEGDVTLRGTVKTAEEKRKIETYSRQTVGAGHVRNELEVEH